MFQIGSDRWHFLYFIQSIIVFNTITILITISTQFMSVTSTISNIQKTINMSSSISLSLNEQIPFMLPESYIKMDNSIEKGINTTTDTVLSEIIQIKMLSTISSTMSRISTSATTVAQTEKPSTLLPSSNLLNDNKFVPNDDNENIDSNNDPTVTESMQLPIIMPSLSLSLLNSSATLTNTSKIAHRTKNANIRISSSSLSLRSMQNSRTAIKSSTSATNSTATKSHKPDAPNMLNYIFDSHLATNKHHHHDRNGPHFDDVATGENLINVSAQAGRDAYLNCRISLLQDKTVSWVKRNQNDDKLELLTVGMQTYSGDNRFNVEFQYPNNWRLKISDTNKSDEGLYECQISTYPPRVIKTFFQVNAPEVIIADEYGSMLIDKYYEVDSTIQLVCIVRHIAMTTSVVYWLHGDRMLNFDTTRGGISVKSNLMDDGANSTLSMAKVRKSDSGNYTCSIGPNDFYTITVHVLNGESLAELYHGKSSHIIVNNNKYCILMLLYLAFYKIINNIVV